MRVVRGLAGVVGVLLLSAGGELRADPGHEVSIAELSAQIEKTPEIPELYYQRAVNYREIGRVAEARADLAKAQEASLEFLKARLKN